MQNLREYKDNMPLTTQLVTILLIKSPIDIQFAVTRDDKESMVREYHRRGGEFVAVWTGETCSHAFNLPAATMIEAFK